MTKEKLLYKLTGTETPKQLTEREKCMIDQFLIILKEQEDGQKEEYNGIEIIESKETLLKLLSDTKLSYRDCISRYQSEINRSEYDSLSRRREELKPTTKVLFRYFPEQFPLGYEAD